MMKVIGLRLLVKGGVKFVEQSKAFFGVPFFREGAKARFSIELSQRHAGKLIDELIHADALARGELLQTLSFRVAHSNGHRGHTSPHLIHKFRRAQNPEVWKIQFSASEVAHVLRHDNVRAASNG